MAPEGQPFVEPLGFRRILLYSRKRNSRRKGDVFPYYIWVYPESYQGKRVRFMAEDDIGPILFQPKKANPTPLLEGAHRYAPHKKSSKGAHGRARWMQR